MTANNSHRDVLIFPSVDSLAEAAAQRFTELAQEAVARRGRFIVALSGGSTPRALHARLAAAPWRDQVPWEQTLVFWGDERFVTPDDPDSCYRMARETLLDAVPVPADQIFPVPTVGLEPAAAAEQYATTIARVFDGEPQRFDLILLGMGPDGHTASLFPGQPEAVSPGEATVIPVFDSPKPPPTRISFSYRLLNAAHHILFLVTGADKAPVLQEVINGQASPARLPSQNVRPKDGEVTWMIDAAAAQQLHRQ